MTSRGHGDRLSRDQERAVATLLVANSIDAAARTLGCHPNCLRGWLKLPAFKGAFEAAKAELLERTIARLQGSLFAVAASLEKDLSDPSAGVRHKAATLLLEHAGKLTEIDALKQRLAKLEQDSAARIARLEALEQRGSS